MLCVEHNPNNNSGWSHVCSLPKGHAGNHVAYRDHIVGPNFEAWGEMTATEYIRAIVKAWGANPDSWDWNAETPRDVRNMLTDIADEIENGRMQI